MVLVFVFFLSGVFLSFFFTVVLILLRKQLLPHFAFTAASRERTWQKPFGCELLRDVETTKTKPNSMESEKAMLGSNQTRFEQIPSHQLQPDQTKDLS